jgi:hypothetical protein
MPWRTGLNRLFFSHLPRSFMKTQRRSDSGGSLPSPSHDDYDDFEDVDALDDASVDPAAEQALDTSDDYESDLVEPQLMVLPPACDPLRQLSGLLPPTFPSEGRAPALPRRHPLL